jgi:hypothetical protein
LRASPSGTPTGAIQIEPVLHGSVARALIERAMDEAGVERIEELPRADWSPWLVAENEAPPPMKWLSAASGKS